MQTKDDLIIVGAGPSGLAAAIAAAKRGLSYTVLEKGVLVNSIFHFPRNMTFFTTPELLEIGGIPFTTPYDKPTRWEGLRYYRRVADAYEIPIAFGERVLSIGLVKQADGCSGFEVVTRADDVTRQTRRSRSVIIATGYYDHPNRLDVPGEDLPHVRHYYTEPHEYYRKKVVVVGGKNSAAIAALELCRGGATVTLIHRRARLSDSIKYWIRPDIENRISEGSIRALFSTVVVRIERNLVTSSRNGCIEEIPADAVLLLTGYHPDTDLMARAGVYIDPATLAPRHDPETMETNVPGLYVAGSVVSGKDTNRIFIENGRFHGDAIVRHILSRTNRG